MATLSLLQHYFDYLRSPPVLLAILMVIGPIALEVVKNRMLSSGPTGSIMPNCFRLGRSKRSNLDDQYELLAKKEQGTAQESMAETAHIKALFTYPIKSCCGVELAASEVGATGLKYDRLFAFAQLVSSQDTTKTSNEGDVRDVGGDWKHEWHFMTQRDFPRLALLKTELWVPDRRAVKGNRANGHAKQSRKAIKRQRGRKEPRDDSSLPESSTDSQQNDKHAEEAWSANGGCLTVRFMLEPDFNFLSIRTDFITLRIPLAPTPQRAKAKEYSYEPLNIWKDCPQAINITNEIHASDLAKLKHFLGASNPLGLFRVDDRNKRVVTRSLPKDRPRESYSIGFGDAFPLHMLSLASVRALDDDIPEKAETVKGKLDARRFRSNIYITGPSAYAEDSWKRITVGGCIRPRNQDGRMVETDGEYHVACRTARCKLPNVDPDTGMMDANEPYTTLGRTRKVDEGAYPHPCLGMQMIPLFAQGILRVGDEVTVLETGEHSYEKMFA